MSHSHLDTVINAIDGGLMMRHMQLFDRYTKYAGTPEELESLRYCEEQMKSYGFETEIVHHDALISIPGKASAVHDGVSLPAISHSFSRSTAPGGLTAAVVDVGSGSPEEFARADVTGKIVLVDGIANPAVSLRASQAGAAGQLHVSPHEHLHEMCVSSVWGSPTHETRSRLPLTVIITIPLEEGQAVRAALVANPGTEVTLFAEVDTGWRKTPILVADLPSMGGDAQEPFIFYTGHHDTWYFGVMDNGGANATMMEVARIAAEHRTEWRRGLRVVFWSGHSQGRYSSSSWYADEHWEELERRALVHVNVDSTGGKGNIIVADTTAAAELRGLASEAIAAYSDQTFSNRRLSRAGDQSFWGIGVPGIFQNMSEQPASGQANASAAVFGAGNRLGRGTGWWWHNPADTLDKIEEGILVRDTKIYMHAIWRLLTDPVLPLDYEAHARYLSEEISAMQKAAGERFDLSVLSERAERLAEAARRFNAVAASAPAERAESLNAVLKAVSRAIVPVDYIACDRFEQDPALAQSPYPSLAATRLFANYETSSDDAKFLTVGMMRARNRVAFALATAIAAFEDGLREFGA